MKNIERSIYIAIIVILVGVLSCGITYIVIKDKNSTDTEDNLKENNNSSINDKIEKEEPTQIDGVKLLRTYQENDKIFQEYEIILNGKRNLMPIVYTYNDNIEGFTGLKSTTGTYKGIEVYRLEMINSSKNNMFNINTIKDHFNEKNFQIINGKDEKKYLTLWEYDDSTGGSANLYIFNNNLELLQDDSFKDYSCIGSNYSMIINDFSTYIVKENQNPWYEDKLNLYTEEKYYINTKIKDNKIYYLVPRTNNNSEDNLGFVEERIYEISNNKLEYKVINTYNIKEIHNQFC